MLFFCLHTAVGLLPFTTPLVTQWSKMHNAENAALGLFCKHLYFALLVWIGIMKSMQLLKYVNLSIHIRRFRVRIVIPCWSYFEHFDIRINPSHYQSKAKWTSVKGNHWLSIIHSSGESYTMLMVNEKSTLHTDNNAMCLAYHLWGGYTSFLVHDFTIS